MRRTVPILVTMLVASVSWIFFKNFTVSGLDQVRVAPKLPGRGWEGGVDAVDTTSRLVELATRRPSSLMSRDASGRQAGRIRVATFRLQSLDEAKIANPRLRQLLVQVVREFDAVALQQIRSSSDTILPTLVNAINRDGVQYDGVVGPRVGPEDAQEQFAFLYNQRTLELDRGELYTVDDRSQVLTYEPLVAWFRTLGPPPNEAFTFSLVSVRLDESTAIQERDLLDDLLLAVKNDGRQEDDVILAGDVQTGPRQISALQDWPGIRFALTDTPTDVLGTAVLDNFVLQSSATREFTGNAGVFDFLRQYNLTLAEASALSDHLVVWAEFSIYEGDGDSSLSAE